MRRHERPRKSSRPQRATREARTPFVHRGALERARYALSQLPDLAESPQRAIARSG